MPVKRRRAKIRHQMPAEFWCLLNDAALPEGANRFRALRFQHSAKDLWASHGAEVMERWILRAPGTRPSLWWQFDAPPDARLRVGGTGALGLEYELTALRRFPAHWISVDPSEPPCFESEASFLRRLGLLRPGEARRLRASSFEPEPLPRQFWPDQPEEPATAWTPPKFIPTRRPLK